MTSRLSVASLDVEKIKRVDAVETMLRKHMQMYDWTKIEARAINDFILTVREGIAEDFAGALASALSGMAELRAAATHYIAIHNRHDSVYIRENGRHGHSPWAELVAAARAPQPEETSADAE